MKAFRNRLNAKDKKKKRMNLKEVPEVDEDLEVENTVIEIEDTEINKKVTEGETGTGKNKMKEFRAKLNARNKKKP